MSKIKLSILMMLAPLAALGLETASLVERVPTLPATVAEARSGLSGREAQAAALKRDIEAAEAELQTRQEAAYTASQQTAEQQQRNLENLTGMSSEEMDAADEDEMMASMFGAMGMNMDDMEAMEGMSDAELEAYFAGKQMNTQGLQQFADAAPKSSTDPALLQRLSQEFGEWQTGYAGRVTTATEQFTALRDRWAQDHRQLDTRLDAEMAPKVASVQVVDCGEAGEYQDMKALRAISIERAEAHTELAPDHLQQGIAYLSARREAVKADAAFADRFTADATGIEEMAAQSVSIQQTALLGITELLGQTLEINRSVVGPLERKDQLAASIPKSECG